MLLNLQRWAELCLTCVIWSSVFVSVGPSVVVGGGASVSLRAPQQTALKMTVSTSPSSSSSSFPPPPSHSVAPVLWPTSNTQFTSQPPYSVWTSTHNTDSHTRPHGSMWSDLSLIWGAAWCDTLIQPTIPQISSAWERKSRLNHFG